MLKKGIHNEIMVVENPQLMESEPVARIEEEYITNQPMRHSVTPIKQNNFKSTSNLSNSTAQHL